MSRSMWAVVAWQIGQGSQRRCKFTGRCDVGRDPASRIILPLASVSRRQLRLEAGPLGLTMHNVSVHKSVRVRGGNMVGPSQSVRLGPGDVVELDGCRLVVLDVVDPETHAATVCANPTCRRQVPLPALDCPWCGRSLAFASSLPGAER